MQNYNKNQFPTQKKCERNKKNLLPLKSEEIKSNSTAQLLAQCLMMINDYSLVLLSSPPI